MVLRELKLAEQVALEAAVEEQLEALDGLDGRPERGEARTHAEEGEHLLRARVGARGRVGTGGGGGRSGGYG